MDCWVADAVMEVLHRKPGPRPILSLLLDITHCCNCGAATVTAYAVVPRSLERIFVVIFVITFYISYCLLLCRIWASRLTVIQLR